ncbi:dTDP-4-dehydrorhamnose reductase [uncultured Sphingomonas sp.]|uniref:dTDP-4-dehydrorhamnose reductase n=1 Tax=uncultured Sphingomonas sp. TaxID=158754 RepID=UPI0035CB8D6E
MKALVTGAHGQLGTALVRSAPEGCAVVAHDRDTLDLTDAAAVRALVDRERPDVILNASAWTAVDAAEANEAAAHAINADAVGTLADAARAIGADLVHVSTDFVFDGERGVPYAPGDEPSPLGAYGRTKLAGELAAGPDALIVRTAWVYGPTGGNFVRTMLRLMAERDEVRVVADQIGTPTYAPDLAAALWRLHAAGARGVFHYTDSGAVSWYDFAVAIQEEAVAAGLLARTVPVIPIATADFPTPAKRPSYSLLDKSATSALLGKPAPHWRANLRILIKDIAAHG